jgi:hypothetical protein
MALMLPVPWKSKPATADDYKHARQLFKSGLALLPAFYYSLLLAQRDENKNAP